MSSVLLAFSAHKQQLTLAPHNGLQLAASMNPSKLIVTLRSVV